MRRRHPTWDEGDMPRHLVEYRAEDWPNPECHPECAYWAAREAWHAENPDAQVSVVARGPDVPWHPEWGIV